MLLLSSLANAFFYPAWLLFVGASSAAIAVTLYRRTPDASKGLTLGLLALALHQSSALYISRSYAALLGGL